MDLSEPTRALWRYEENGKYKYEIFAGGGNSTNAYGRGSLGPGVVRKVLSVYGKERKGKERE